MQIDPAQLSHAENYKLLTNLVIPRPIAWVTTINEQDEVNLAPFSFFNALGSDPIFIMISVAPRDTGELKDTARNIIHRKEYVVNMVVEELMDAMNISAADFPPDQSELHAAKLETAPSVKIKTPRLAHSPVNFECKLHSTQLLGENTLIIGEIVMFHVHDSLIGERLHINNFHPIGRLGSPSMYCRTHDRFNLTRINYKDWHQKNS